MNKVFSIIVPCYKVEKYINKCVDSILSQDFDDYELILVDDGSPDNSPKILDDYRKKNNKIIVIHKPNGGLVSARNAGLEKATGEYVLHLDGDDWIKEGTLRNIYETAIKKHNPDMVITNMTKVYNDHAYDIPNLVDEGLYEKEKLDKEIIPYMMFDNRKGFYHGLVFPSAGGKIIKTSLLKKHYCDNEKIRMGEDNAYLFECVYYSKKVYFSDIHYYMYKINDDSMVRGYDPTRFDNNKLLIEYIEKRLKGKDKRIDYQINVFKAYWLIMAIFHEIKCKRKYIDIRKHVKEKVKETRAIENIDINSIPKFAKYYIWLVKHKLYFILIPATRLLVFIRDKKES